MMNSFKTLRYCKNIVIQRPHSHKHSNTNSVTLTHAHIPKDIHTNSCAQTHTFIHIHTNTNIYTNIWTQNHAHTHVHTNTRTQNLSHKRMHTQYCTNTVTQTHKICYVFRNPVVRMSEKLLSWRREVLDEETSGWKLHPEHGVCGQCRLLCYHQDVPLCGWVFWRPRILCWK